MSYAFNDVSQKRQYLCLFFDFLRTVRFPEDKIEAKVYEREKESCNNIQSSWLPINRISLEIIWHFILVDLHEFHSLLSGKCVVNNTT